MPTSKPDKTNWIALSSSAGINNDALIIPCNNIKDVQLTGAISLYSRNPEVFAANNAKHPVLQF